MEKSSQSTSVSPNHGKKNTTPKSEISSVSTSVPEGSTRTSSRGRKTPKEDVPRFKKTKSDCFTLSTTSGTQFFRKEIYKETFERITTDQYFGISESISGSSLSFQCVHGPEGKQYSQKGLLKRNILKELDPAPVDPMWTDSCAPSDGWDLFKTVEFLVCDPVGPTLTQRLESNLADLCKTSSKGYRIDVLNSLCVIVDYLGETMSKTPNQEYLVQLLKNMEKPILLRCVSDVVTYFEDIRAYMGFMIYLLMRLEDDGMFEMASKAMLYQLSAPDSVRGPGTAKLRPVITAAAPVIRLSSVRMLALSSKFRFPTFLQITLLLAYDNADNCREMLLENIIENIFYRFNPYFPERDLPLYDINPADSQDSNVKLGDSSIHLQMTLSLLLILIKTAKEFLEQYPNYRQILPYPDEYSQSCFIWAYRYECLARDHYDERITMTAITAGLLHCYGQRLTSFSTYLMADIMSLAVSSEVPLRNDWVGRVNFNTSQSHVQFKKALIWLSVDFIKVFPHNYFMVEWRLWLMGLMYMIDPGLCYLRARWSPALFAELRKNVLQALICVLPLTPPRLAVEYGLTRRILWYIEWYSESPFELPVLYWCMRLLQVIVENRDKSEDRSCLTDLFDTHGVIILIHLCYTLLHKQQPPVEKAQAILGLTLRLLTNAVDVKKKLSCCVYPSIKWPTSINNLVLRMLDVVQWALRAHRIVSDRWLVNFMDFIWEGVIWNTEYRTIFIANNGMYKLLDIIAVTRAPVQCIALAMVCDIALDGTAVGQLVTWRANLTAEQVRPNIVKRGATIASLLAAVFRDECENIGVQLDENGVIQNLECPIMSVEVRKAIHDANFLDRRKYFRSASFVAADLAGSRLSKAFSLLHLLSEDLKYMVALADQSYNMYKNITLGPQEEATLVLCSHYLTLKLNEVWFETHLGCPGFLPDDQELLAEFLHIGTGWAKEIKREQERVIEKDRKKESEEESSLYAFLGRVRLNTSLDALVEVRRAARSSDRARMTCALIHDAVIAHHRRSFCSSQLEEPLLKTYGSMLDDQNITGQYVKVQSIQPKNKVRLHVLPQTPP